MTTRFDDVQPLQQNNSIMGRQIDDTINYLDLTKLPKVYHCILTYRQFTAYLAK